MTAFARGVIGPPVNLRLRRRLIMTDEVFLIHKHVPSHTHTNSNSLHIPANVRSKTTYSGEGVVTELTAGRLNTVGDVRNEPAKESSIVNASFFRLWPHIRHSTITDFWKNWEWMFLPSSRPLRILWRQPPPFFFSYPGLVRYKHEIPATVPYRKIKFNNSART